MMARPTMRKAEARCLQQRKNRHPKRSRAAPEDEGMPAELVRLVCQSQDHSRYVLMRGGRPGSGAESRRTGLLQESR